MLEISTRFDRVLDFCKAQKEIAKIPRPIFRVGKLQKETAKMLNDSFVRLDGRRARRKARALVRQKLWIARV